MTWTFDSGYSFDMAGLYFDTDAPQYDSTYVVEFDTGRDGTFAEAIDTVSGVLALQWSNGMVSPHDDVAPPSRCSVTLLNQDGRFDPARSGAAYADKIKPGVLMRVKMSVGGVSKQVWLGRVLRLNPNTGIRGEAPLLEVVGADLMLELETYEFSPELQLNATVDEAIDQIFTSGAVVYPYEARSSVGYCRVGTARTYNPAAIRRLDAGVSEIVYAGAQDKYYRSTVAAMDHIRDTVAHECGGRFFFDGREGLFRFQARHHDYFSVRDVGIYTLDADDLLNLQASYGDETVNQITLRYQPRAVGTPASVLWESTAVPISIEPGETTRIIARFHDPETSSTMIPATDVIEPVPGIDLVSDNNYLLEVATQINATSAEFIIRNAGIYLITITTLRIRGTPLLAYDQEEIQKTDKASVLANSRRPRIINSPIQSPTLAEDYARYLLANYATPSVRFRSMLTDVRSGNMRCMGLAHNYGIGTVVALSDPTSEVSGTYTIVGEQHGIQPGAARQHTASYTLRKFSNGRASFVGTAQVGTARVVF